MNISEFAKIAGVSKSAVSRYFNNGYLAEEKRQLIEAARMLLSAINHHDSVPRTMRLDFEIVERESTNRI